MRIALLVVGLFNVATFLVASGIPHQKCGDSGSPAFEACVAVGAIAYAVLIGLSIVQYFNERSSTKVSPLPRTDHEQTVSR